MVVFLTVPKQVVVGFEVSVKLVFDLRLG